MSEKYFKLSNSKEEEKKDKERKLAVQKIKKITRKTIIKKTIKNNNFSPLMKIVYKLSIL
tara:strand:- start:763 stop:942 length:180 start_codon:yes stop_codon:yes gene_type:complete